MALVEPVERGGDDGGSQVVAVVEELLRPSTNPMLIDVVIDNMFGYCDFETLGRCRQVSKQWFKVSLPHWLKQGPKLALRLELLDDEEDHVLNPNKPSVRYPKSFNVIPKFLQLVSPASEEDEYYKSCGLRQYTKFRVGAGGSHNLRRRREILADFFRECGGRMTELKVEVGPVDLETYQNVMLSRMAPNLVTLEATIWFGQDVELDSWAFRLEQEEQAHEKLTTLMINIHTWRYEGGDLVLPELLWIQLLKRYPNLKTLVYGVASNSSPSRPENVDRMLETVWAIRQVDKKQLDLKRLEIYCEGDRGEDYDLDSLLPLVRDTQLALETFRFSIGELAPDQTIYDVLESQAGTLKTLVLHNHRDGPLEDEFELPKMCSVTSLELHGRRLFPNLGFLKGFPCLESLIFNLASEANNVLENGADELALILNGTNEESLEGLMCPRLSKLHVNYERVKGALRPKGIRKLHRVMPDLTDVQLWLGNECFRAVVECWPGLKSLCIIGNGVNNEGVVGRVAPDGNMLPNVRNLTELESFAMRHIGYDDDEDDISYKLPTAISGDAVNVLLHLPKLTRLEVTLDKEREQKLEHLQNTPVIRVQGREIHVKIRFEDRLDEFDDVNQVDPDGDSSSGEEAGENYQNEEGDGDENESVISDAGDERDGDGEGVMEEGERDDDDDERQDADGIEDDGAE